MLPALLQAFRGSDNYSELKNPSKWIRTETKHFMITREDMHIYSYISTSVSLYMRSLHCSFDQNNYSSSLLQALEHGTACVVCCPSLWWGGWGSWGPRMLEVTLLLRKATPCPSCPHSTGSLFLLVISSLLDNSLSFISLEFHKHIFTEICRLAEEWSLRGGWWTGVSLAALRRESLNLAGFTLKFSVLQCRPGGYRWWQTSTILNSIL